MAFLTDRSKDRPKLTTAPYYGPPRTAAERALREAMENTPQAVARRSALEAEKKRIAQEDATLRQLREAAKQYAIQESGVKVSPELHRLYQSWLAANPNATQKDVYDWWSGRLQQQKQESQAAAPVQPRMPTQPTESSEMGQFVDGQWQSSAKQQEMLTAYMRAPNYEQIRQSNPDAFDESGRIRPGYSVSRDARGNIVNVTRPQPKMPPAWS